METRFLIYRRKIIDDRVSGTYVFVSNLDLNESYFGMVSNKCLGWYGFPDHTTYPEFTASQQTDAYMWASRHGTKLGLASDDHWQTRQRHGLR